MSWICALVLLTGCVGCGSGTARIFGDVSYGGEAVENGTISFTPADPTRGPTTGARVAGGKYDVPAEKGVLPGVEYRVEIVALRKSGKKIANFLDPKGPPLELEEQFLPETYNKASTLRVTPGRGANQVHFHLERRPNGDTK